MTDGSWREFGDMAELATALSERIGTAVQDSVARRGECLLACPGGSTPRPVFERLAQADLPWTQVTIIPTDERLVAPTSELSNHRLLTRSFGLSGARIMPLVDEVTSLSRSAERAEQRLRSLDWPPELVWLGMGGDGHSASIFAGPDLEVALDPANDRLAVGVTPDPLPPEAPVARITLTCQAILSARAIIVLITGEAKRALLRQAIGEGSRSALPIGRLLAGARQAPQIYWCP